MLGDLQDDQFRWSGPDDDPEKIARFFNYAGEVSNTLLWPLLKRFGEQFIFHQQVGRNGNSIIERTMHGFHSLQVALAQALEIRAYAQSLWEDHIHKVAYKGQSGKISLVNFKQDPVPGFLFIFPTDYDRQVGGVSREYPVWAMAFPVCMAQSAITNGGVMFE